jgi:PAS domain S-box-containing protein
LVGMLSTHYRTARRPVARDLGVLDMLARQAADWMERTQAEEAVHQVTTRLELALQGSDIGVWDLELTDGTLEHSQVAFSNVWEQLGYASPGSPPTFAGGISLAHPEDRAPQQEFFRAYLAGETPQLEFEHRLRHKNGSYHTMLVRGVAIRDAAGKPTRVVGSRVDITGRIAAEEGQRRLQRERDEVLARLQLQFERMPIACLLFDRQGQVIEWNPAAETTFGYRRDEVMSRHGFQLLVPPALRSRLKGLVDRLVSGDMSAHSVNENLTKDGRRIICEWHNTPLRDATGEVIAILSMAQDITERKRAEEALRGSEERYRSLISQVRDFAIFSTDERGGVTTWNEGCQHVFAYDREEFVGLDDAELFTPEDRAQGVPAVERRQAAEGGTTIVDRWMIAKDGRRFFAMGATAAVRDPAGRLMGFSTVIRDLTQMKATQDELASHGESLERLVTERTDQLEKTTERLRLSERMASLGTLAAGLGHDMGNLLLPLDIRLDLLLQADLPRDLHEHVMGIQKCARYLQRLSNGLRLLATDPSADRTSEATELGTWWNDVNLILKDVLPRGIRFEHDLPSGKCWVAIGRTGLTQAVFNLVQNAADALKERGAGLVRITAGDTRGEGEVVVRVADDGPGMTEEVARRCLEPYFSTKARGESTGMGLAFVHGLVNGSGGHVDIQSTLGLGTTVSLILPRAKFIPAGDGQARGLRHSRVSPA